MKKKGKGIRNNRRSTEKYLSRSATEHLTTEHSDDVRQKMHQDAEIVRSMANQLFVQAFITIDLILETLHTAINYFAQRLPTELGQFQWTIDGKDRSATRMEEIWSALILPIGQARSAQEPFAKLEGFDYSHFSPYEIVESTADEGTRKHLECVVLFHFANESPAIYVALQQARY